MPGAWKDVRRLYADREIARLQQAASQRALSELPCAAVGLLPGRCCFPASRSPCRPQAQTHRSSRAIATQRATSRSIVPAAKPGADDWPRWLECVLTAVACRLCAFRPALPFPELAERHRTLSLLDEPNANHAITTHSSSSHNATTRCSRCCRRHSSSDSCSRIRLSRCCSLHSPAPLSHRSAIPRPRFSALRCYGSRFGA